MVADFRAIPAGAIAAGFRIGRDQERDLAVCLQDLVLVVDFLGIARIVADRSDVVRIDDTFKVTFLAAGSHVDKQLADFFFHGHPGDGVLDPSDPLVIQEIRFLMQINSHDFQSPL